MRGPAIIDPATGNQILMGSQQYMELTNNALIGSANLTKTLPLLPNLRKSYIQPLHPIETPHQHPFNSFDTASQQVRRKILQLKGGIKLKILDVKPSDSP